jgi:hypothetical protein
MVRRCSSRQPRSYRCANLGGAAACPRRGTNESGAQAMNGSVWKRYGFAWVTLGFFLISLAGHWVFGWFAYVNEQQAHEQPVQISEYVVQMTRDTLENWQSEFLQLVWQVAGLALLLYVGSPQSKEGNDRMEAKIDALLRRTDPEGADRVIAEIAAAYSGRGTDIPHGQR